MNCVILTRNSQNFGFIKNVLNLEGLECKISSDFCQLERYARNFVLEILFVDNEYFRFPSDDDFLGACLGVLNSQIPKIYIDKDNFKQAIDINRNIELEMLKPEIKRIFENTIMKIDEFNNISNEMLRPAEKKLYSLLKNNNEKAVSLDEMSLFLWGCSNDGHMKTLYAYINRIKKILEDKADNLESLTKERKGFYKIQMKPINKDCQICPDFMDLF